MRLNEDGTIPHYRTAAGQVVAKDEALAELGTGEDGGPHTHAESDVTGLTDDLSAKAAASHSHAEYATDTDLSDHAATTHGTSAHAISGVMHTGSLDHSALGSVTANQHHNQSHALGGGDHSGSLAQASVTNLVSDLSGKAASTHDHDADYAAIDHTHAGGSEAFPVGSVFLSVVSTNPATLLGYGTWSSFGQGRMLLGWDTGDTDEATGGSATHAHAGHSDHAALTHAGAAVAAHSFTQPTAAVEAAHTHAYTQVPNHVHVEALQGGTTGTTTGTHLMGSASTGGSLRNAGQSTNNPTGGVASGTTAAGSSHTHSMSGGAVDAHSVTQPNQHAAQSHSAHDSASNVPPYITVRMWKRTA